VLCIKHRSRSPTGGLFKPGFGFPPEPEVSARARTTVVDALDKYSEYIRYHRSLRTFRTYRPILAGFKNFCPKTYIDEIAS
jgi:hypothetical protein